ncbi:MAG: hypothetical protein ACK56I_11000, partial [bacterium]
SLVSTNSSKPTHATRGDDITGDDHQITARRVARQVCCSKPQDIDPHEGCLSPPGSRPHASANAARTNIAKGEMSGHAQTDTSSDRRQSQLKPI